MVAHRQCMVEQKQAKSLCAPHPSRRLCYWLNTPAVTPKQLSQLLAVPALAPATPPEVNSRKPPVHSPPAIEIGIYEVRPVS